MRVFQEKIISSIFYLYIAASCGLFAVLFVSGDSQASVTGSQLFIGSWLCLYGLSFLIVLSYKFKLNKLNLLVLAIPSFHLISFIWSNNPGKTITYSMCFILNALFAIALSNHYNYQSLLKGLLKVLLVMIISGLFFNLIGYDNVKYLDIHSRENILGAEPIRGFFNHKITAGLYAVIALLISCCLLKGVKRNFTVVLCIYFILMTGSAAAIVLSLVAYVCLYVVKFSCYKNLKPKTFVLIMLSMIIIFISLFSIIAEPLLLALGRDPTLTGRTILWRWGIEVALEKPLLGWGYLGYFGTNTAHFIASTYTQFQNYDVPHFHSSLIQILAEGGFIYTTLLFVAIFYTIGTWYKIYLLQRDNYSILMVSIMMLLFFGSFVVYYFSRYNDFSTIFMLMAIAFIPKSKAGLIQ